MWGFPSPSLSPWWYSSSLLCLSNSQVFWNVGLLNQCHLDIYKDIESLGEIAQEDLCIFSVSRHEGSLPCFGGWSSAVGAPCQQHLPRRGRQDGSPAEPLGSGGPKCWCKAHSVQQRLWRITIGKSHPHAQTRKTCSKAGPQKPSMVPSRRVGRKGSSRTEALLLAAGCQLLSQAALASLLKGAGWASCCWGSVSLKQIRGWTCKNLREAMTFNEEEVMCRWGHPVSPQRSAVANPFTSPQVAAFLSKSYFFSQPLSPAEKRQSQSLSCPHWPWQLVGANNWEEGMGPESSCMLVFACSKARALARVPPVCEHCHSTNTINKNSPRASLSCLGTACSKGMEQCLALQQPCLLLHAVSFSSDPAATDRNHLFLQVPLPAATPLEAQR